MQTIRNISIILVVALLVCFGYSQMMRLAPAQPTDQEAVNAYPKVGVITIAGPALVLAKWNSKTSDLADKYHNKLSAHFKKDQ